MVDDLISSFLPPGVMNFLIPGVIGGVVIFIVIWQFGKVLFKYDILEGIL